ncbi:MAG TPA: ATPase domain-containing protein [Thermoplasmata archaeon]|nr:ATPase domain-containing protein [Thermoplasmata archaeon]
MNDGAAEGISAPSASVRTADAGALAKALGVGTDTAETLIAAGYASTEQVRGMSESALEQLGVATADVERIRHPEPGGATGAPVVDPDRIVERWAGTVRKAERPRRRRVTIPSKGSTDTLRKWVDGDDGALEEWIQSSETPRASTGPAAVPTHRFETAEPGRARPDAAATPVLEREETVVRWLTGLLDRVKTDQFDPSALIQESQDLQRQLFDERTKRKQLEEEVEHVKRGSIAVIKYVRSHEAKEREVAVRAKDDEIAEMKLRLLALEGAESSPERAAVPAPAGGPSARPTPEAIEKASRELEGRLREEFSEREHAYIERETDLRRRSVQLESEVRNLHAELERSRERGEILAGNSAAIGASVDQRLKEVDQRERDLLARENELRTRFEEIRIHADEIDRRRSPLEVKERELAVTDQQLQARQQALDSEARRIEGLRQDLAGSGGANASEEARRVEALLGELRSKEELLRAREAVIAKRQAELEKLALRGSSAESDSSAPEPAPTAEVKVKSGIRRLDDLLYGGFPVATQLLINGPAHTGKDVLARLFSVEGLRLDIPSIWVVTDSTWNQVRDDLAALYPKYADAEKAGMVRFVDLYSRSVVGSPTAAPGVRMLSSTDKGVLEQIGQIVNGYSEELKEKFSTYRLIFESVSTVTAYLDTASTFRFLQPFIGRRKIDQAVAYYVLDRGMHSDADLETLEHMVDGSLNLKVEQLKTFLSVKGVGETQSRAWIGYTFTKRSLNLGSFSLDHIR